MFFASTDCLALDARRVAGDMGSLKRKVAAFLQAGGGTPKVGESSVDADSIDVGQERSESGRAAF